MQDKNDPVETAKREYIEEGPMSSARLLCLKVLRWKETLDFGSLARPSAVAVVVVVVIDAVQIASSMPKLNHFDRIQNQVQNIPFFVSCSTSPSLLMSLR